MFEVISLIQALTLFVFVFEKKERTEKYSLPTRSAFSFFFFFRIEKLPFAVNVKIH